MCEVSWAQSCDSVVTRQERWRRRLRLTSFVVGIAVLVCLIVASSRNPTPVLGRKVQAEFTGVGYAPASHPAGGELPSHKDRDLRRLSRARQHSESAAKAILSDYGAAAEQLMRSFHSINHDYLRRKMARATLVAGTDFVISFSGTSVTAGHDNYLWQAYPAVFHRELNESFAAAGVNLVVRNHAMGNNPPIPMAFCLDTMLGSDTDVAVWEAGMMVGGKEKAPLVETWIRNAIALPKRPALMFLDPGEGARKPEGQEQKLPTEPRGGLPDDWSRSFQDEGKDLLRHYSAFGPHTQAMFEGVWSLDHLPRFNYQALVATDKPSPRPAGWHPGPGGHALRGRILAYHYLRTLADALADAHLAVEANTAEELLQKDDPVIPEAIVCDKEFCGRPSRCATTFEPRAEGGLLDNVVSPHVHVKRAMEDGDSSQWHVQLFSTDIEAVKHNLKFGYLDLKFALHGNPDAGPLTLKVQSQSEGRMLLCMPPGLWGRLPESCGKLWEAAEVKVDGHVVAWEDAEWTEKRYLHSATCAVSTGTFLPGDHAVVVTPNVQGKYIALSSLITF